MADKIVKLSAEQLKGTRQPRFSPCSHGRHESCVAFHDMFVCGCGCHRSSTELFSGTTDEGEYEIGGEG